MKNHGNHHMISEQLKGGFQIINTIDTLEELDGYAKEARRQGVKPGEVSAIEARRKVLLKREGRA